LISSTSPSKFTPQVRCVWQTLGDHHGIGRRFLNNSRLPSNLAVIPILDFTRVGSAGAYRPSLRLATMPSRSFSAHGIEQIHAGADHVVYVQERRRRGRHDLPQSALPLQQGQVPVVAPVQPQQINPYECRATPCWTARSCTSAQTASRNSAISSAAEALQGDRLQIVPGLCQSLRACQEVLLRDQAYGAVFQLCHRAEAVILHLENPIRVVEGREQFRQGHGDELGDR
jgi:hypothetical protein